jgi:hypothetical protein
MKTNKIFKTHNRNLMLRLIPSKELSIYGNSFIDPKDIAFNFTLKQNGIKI